MRSPFSVQHWHSVLLILIAPALGFAQTGPAGVGTATTNRLWLKADANVYNNAGITLAADGDLVQQWNDRSGNANNASQATSANRPIYKTNIINGKPALQFTGDTFIDPGALGIPNTNGYTYIVVFNPTSVTTGALTDGAGDYIIDRTTGTNGLAGLKFTLNGGTNRYAFQKRDDAGGGLGGLETTTAVTTSTFHLVDYSRERIVGAQYRLYLDGALNATVADGDGNTTPPTPRIGRHATTANNGLKGYIAELLIYNYRVNDAQIKILNSYLGAKYNLAIANDKYTYDATHGNDVAGIGSEGVGIDNVDAQSASMLEINTPSTMASGDYLLFGHDNASIASWTTTEAPNSGTNIQRIAREWRLNETGDVNGVGTMKFTIDASQLPALSGGGYTKYAVMIDADGDFSSGALVYETSFVSGTTYETASNIDINNGDYVSIAEVRPTIGFTASTNSGFETSNAVNAVTLNYIAKTAVTVTVNTANVTAAAPGDYTAIAGGTVTVAVGTSSVNTTVTVINDVALEGDETFTVTLSGPTGGVNLGSIPTLTYTIHDDDNTRKVYFTAASSSGNENVAAVTLTVSDAPNQDNTNPTTVDYFISGGTATGGGVDYTLLGTGTVTILAGTTTRNISLTVVDDALFESNETIIVSLTNPTNSNLSTVNPVAYTYTIIDNDVSPTIQFTTTTGNGSESVTPANFAVSLSAASGVSASVNYTVSGGTATGGGVDYTLASGTLTLAAGATTGNIVATIIDDAVVEFSETIIVTLSSPTNASLGANTTFTYTILDNDVFGYKGPGGVGDQSTNKLWVSADANVYSNAGTTLASNGNTVQQWNDRSGNANNVSQGTAGSRPTYNTGIVNGKPSLTFNNHFMDAGALGISNTGGYTYFVVFNPTSVGSTGATSDGSGDYILDRTSGTNELTSLKITAGNTLGYQKRDDGGGGLGGPTTAAVTVGTFQIVDYMRVRGTAHRIYLNGTVSSVADGDGNLTPPITRIGRHQSGATQGLKGYLPELAIYNTSLNSAQRIIVENYLSSKYGIAILAGSDRFAFDATNGNDVAGIGMEDASNFHTDAQGGSIVRINSASSMDPGDYLLWGHDNGSFTTTEQVDIPVGTQARLRRIWKGDERGEIGTVDISFDLTGLGAVTASDLRLLIDKTSNGFADETVGAGTVISGAASMGSNVYKFSGINIDNGWRFTLGTINKTQTPLPISLTDFTAMLSGNQVNVKWTTATEQNNDFFTVERSQDGMNFESLTTVNGAGNSTRTLNYTYTDIKPYFGVSYYRLRQTDYDKNSTTSKIVSVNNEGSKNVVIYPNPAHDEVNIQLRGEAGSEISLYNLFGQRVRYISATETRITLDVSMLPKGVYIVKINRQGLTESHRIIIE